jgi:hypothetical protein
MGHIKENKMIVRIIGDVHGKIPQYCELIKNVPYSIQLGDMGHSYNGLKDVNPDNHKIIAGNHESFPDLTPHFLTGFGIQKLGGLEFLYVHGAFSVDHQWRTQGIDVFEEEEIDWEGLQLLTQEWPVIKPKIVVSHSCPADLLKYVGSLFWASKGVGASRTANALQSCWELWQPEQWFFGHYHKSFHETINGTEFHCLDELECYDL